MTKAAFITIGRTKTFCYDETNWQISRTQPFNPTCSHCIRMRDTIGIILFDLRRLFGSGKNSINKVCMSYLCLLWEGLDLGPTFYGDEIFLVSTHIKDQCT